MVGDLFYVLPCVILFLCFFCLFSIAITSLGEERAKLSAFRAFNQFALVWFCLFPLRLGVWEGPRFVIVALPGLFSYLFFPVHMTFISSCSIPDCIFFQIPGYGLLTRRRQGNVVYPVAFVTRFSVPGGIWTDIC